MANVRLPSLESLERKLYRPSRFKAWEQHSKRRSITGEQVNNAVENPLFVFRQSPTKYAFLTKELMVVAETSGRLVTVYDRINFTPGIIDLVRNLQNA